MTNRFAKITVTDYIDAEEKHAIENFSKDELNIFPFKRIIANNEIWSITDGRDFILIPPIDNKKYVGSCPIYPSSGVAKAVKYTAMEAPENIKGAHILADLYPISHTIDNFTNDIIKTMDNLKDNVGLILYTYDTAVELSTKEFLQKLEEFK